jgi:hypothetical protein
MLITATVDALVNELATTHPKDVRIYTVFESKEPIA